MTASANIAFRFNGFRLDPVRRLLFGADGKPIPLKPKVFATLLYLVERPGELIDKQALLEAVWPHVVVEENNLNKAISTLRQVFGEARDSHRFIVTEPGRGYRFVATVETARDGATGAPRAPAEVASPPEAYGAPGPAAARALPDGQPKSPRRMLAAGAVAMGFALAAIGAYWFANIGSGTADTTKPEPFLNSIAVLPFTNLSPNPDHAYFAVGIHEELLNQLTKIEDLRVASRTSVQGYAGTQKATPEIARELNVETVLDGSVRYAEGQVAVTVRLSDGASNTLVWSQSYEFEFSDILAIQSEIALNVARALKAELLPAERDQVTRAPTTSLRAYDLYLSAAARYRRDTREQVSLAIEEVEQALALDADFALAWVLKSNLLTSFQYYDPERRVEHRAGGEQAARRALALDPLLGRAHAALGYALSTMKEFTAAEAAYRKALDLNVPLGDGNAYGVLQLQVANFRYALEIARETREAVPQEAINLRFMVLANALLDNWPTALAQYELGMRLFVPWREAENLMRHLRVGRNELEEARAIPAADPINEAMIENLDAPEIALRELHRMFAATGLDRPNDRRDIGLWAGHFGDARLALDAMRSAVTEQGGLAVYLWLPQLKEMRQSPEFKEFIREIGIVAHWEAYGWPDICRPSNGDDFECD
jgi:TolB-like protein/DNA-binding winged helix-turn-helix (wHTH) protein